MKPNEIEIKNVLSLKESRASILRAELHNLYKAIENDNFSTINSDEVKMAYYGVRQGQFFKVFRETLGLSLSDVAKEIDLSLIEVVEIESGDFIPDEDITKRYATAVGAVKEMNYFLDFFEN